eukprot:1108346_1
MSLILAASLFIHQAFSADWDYDDKHHNTSHWKSSGEWPECSGTHQSPIDIPIPTDTCDEPLQLPWTSETVHFAIRNNGHSLQAVPFEITQIGGSSAHVSRMEVLHHANDTNIRLQNAFYHTYESLVNYEYYFDSLHVHFGIDSDSGSEHTIDGSHYPLEVHLVHFSGDYDVIGDALNAYVNDEFAELDDHHVLAVIGVLFEIGDPNPVLDKILNDVIINGLRIYNPEGAPDGVIEMFYTEFDPMDLLPQNKSFVGYKGSLTTPPCYETVRWHVMQHKMTVSEAQMEQFRSLLTSSNETDSMAPNWRPTQDLNNRTIYECNEDIEADAVHKEDTHDDTHWSYRNASRWPQLGYPECSGLSQSPIDISTEEDMSECDEVLELDWSTEPVHFGIRNVGHSIQAIPFEITHLGGPDITRLEVLHHTNDTSIRLRNSFYNTYTSAAHSEYCFDSFHAHWGETNEYGSEHSLNGEYYPLEVHFVHYSCDFYEISDAVEAYADDERLSELDDHHVLAVVGVLFAIGDANPALDKILSDVIVNGVRYYDPDSAVDNMLQLFYTELNLTDLLPESKEFIGYKGSLTTPPCYETVRWHVMKQPMTVSEQQMRQFRRLFGSLDEQIAPNWRPLQEIGNRTMYQCNDVVELERVDKEVTEEDVYDEEQLKKAVETWFVIGVLFICLFGVAVIIIIVLVRKVYYQPDKMAQGDTRSSGYQKTNTVDPEEVMIQKDDYH